MSLYSGADFDPTQLLALSAGQQPIDPLELLAHHLAAAHMTRQAPAPRQPLRAPMPHAPLVGPTPPDAGDPYNPYNGTPGGGSQGVSIDPRYIAQLAQQMAGAMGGSAPGGAALPAYAPVVANQTAQPHPGWYTLAQALQHAAAAYNDSGGRQNTGFAGALNLLGGAGGAYAQRGAALDTQNAANRESASKQNQLNYLASQEAAKEERAVLGRIREEQAKPLPPSSIRSVLPTDASLIKGAVAANIITPQSAATFSVGMTDGERQQLATKGVPGAASGTSPDDYKGIAADVVSGNAPAYPGYYTRGTWNHVASELHKMKDTDGRPINTTKLILDYTGARQLAATMGENQMVSYRLALVKATPTLDYVDTLANQLQTQIPQGRVKILNGIALQAAANGVYGPEAADTATKLLGQIAGPLVGDMAQVYSKGGAPTNEARAQVSTQISANMGGSLPAAIAGMRRDLNFANTAVTEVQPFRMQNAGGPGYGQGAGVRFRLGNEVRLVTDPVHIAALRADPKYQEVP